MRVPGLYQFFRRQVQRGLDERGLARPATVDYVSDLLARFAHTRSLFVVRDAQGMPVETVAGLLVEWHRAHGWEDKAAADRPREALIVRHIGEYTLFMSGVFRERLAARGQLGYYVSHGRNAFWRCATRERNPREAEVFYHLCHDFDRISGALDALWHRHLPIAPDAPVPSPLAALWRT